ncbi:hypothetical protein ACFVTZ_13835 [Cellulosimicrobium cellulans]|uniref:hypothetical protein n=1 Tax=Cellulosimicrobium cellulans TaxID=1710 RepID=UPI0036EFA33F
MTRTRTAALVAALTLTTVAVPVTTAVAAPVVTTAHVAGAPAPASRAVAGTAGSTGADPVGLERDADGTPLLRLTGPVTPEDAVLVDGALLGQVVVVPGDSGGVVLRVRNEGPTGGTLTVSIVDAIAHRDPGGDGWADDAFYDDLTVDGVPASRLEGRRTVVHEAELARGASVDVPVTYDFPAAATSGNRAFVGERLFSFDLLVRIGGDVPATETHGDDATSGGTAVDRARGLVARTGGAAEADGAPWWAAAAGGLVLVAAGAARALRRHSVGPDGRRPGGGPDGSVRTGP